MREILTIQDEPIGTKFVTKALDNLSDKPDIDFNGCQMTDNFSQLDSPSTQYREGFVKQFVPRVVIIDWESCIANSIQAGGCGRKVDSNNMVSGDPEVWNSRPKGSHACNAEKLVDQSIEFIRKKLSRADLMEGIQIRLSMNGEQREGTALLSKNKTTSKSWNRICSNLSTLHFFKISDVVLEPCNAILSLAHLLELCDRYFCVCNDTHFISRITHQRNLVHVNHRNSAQSVFLTSSYRQHYEKGHPKCSLLNWKVSRRIVLDQMHECNANTRARLSISGDREISCYMNSQSCRTDSNEFDVALALVQTNNSNSHHSERSSSSPRIHHSPASSDFSLIEQRTRSISPSQTVSGHMHSSSCFSQQISKRKEHGLNDDQIECANSEAMLKDETGQYMDNFIDCFEQQSRFTVPNHRVQSNSKHTASFAFPAVWEQEKSRIPLEPWDEDESWLAAQNVQQTQMSNAPMVSVLPVMRTDPRSFSSHSMISTVDPWNHNGLKHRRSRGKRFKSLSVNVSGWPDGKISGRLQQAPVGVEDKIKRSGSIGGRLPKRSSSESPTSISHANTEPVKSERKYQHGYGVVFRLNQQDLRRGSHQTTHVNGSEYPGSEDEGNLRESFTLIQESERYGSSQSANDAGMLTSETISRQTRKRLSTHKSYSFWQKAKPEPGPIFYDVSNQRQLHASSYQQPITTSIGGDSRSMYYTTSTMGVTTRRKLSMRKAGLDVSHFPAPIVMAANRINSYGSQLRYPRLPPESFGWISDEYRTKEQRSPVPGPRYRPEKLVSLETSPRVANTQFSFSPNLVRVGHKGMAIMLGETNPLLAEKERSTSSFTQHHPNSLRKYHEFNRRIPNSSLITNNYERFRSERILPDLNKLITNKSIEIVGQSESTTSQTDGSQFPKLLFNLPVEPLSPIRAAGIKLIATDQQPSEPYRNCVMALKIDNVVKDAQTIPIVAKHIDDKLNTTMLTKQHSGSSRMQNGTEATDFGLSMQNLDAPHICPNDHEGHTHIDLNYKICQLETQMLGQNGIDVRNTDEEIELCNPYGVKKEAIHSSESLDEPGFNRRESELDRTIQTLNHIQPESSIGQPTSSVTLKKTSLSTTEANVKYYKDHVSIASLSKSETLEVNVEEDQSLNRDKVMSDRTAKGTPGPDRPVCKSDNPVLIDHSCSPMPPTMEWPTAPQKYPSTSDSLALGHKSPCPLACETLHVPHEAYVSNVNRKNTQTDANSRSIQHSLEKETKEISSTQDLNVMNEHGSLLTSWNNQQYISNSTTLDAKKSVQYSLPSQHNQHQFTHGQSSRSLPKQSNSSQPTIPSDPVKRSHSQYPPYGSPVPGMGPFQCPTFLPYNTEIGVLITHQMPLPIFIPGGAPISMSVPNPWVQCTNTGLLGAQPPSGSTNPTMETGGTSSSPTPGSNTSMECLIRMIHGGYPTCQSTSIPSQPKTGVPNTQSASQSAFLFPTGPPTLLRPNTPDNTLGQYMSVYSWIRLVPPVMGPSTGLYGVRASQLYRRQSHLRRQMNVLLAKRYSSLSPEERKNLDQLLHELGAYNPNRNPADQAKLNELLSKPFDSLTAEEKRTLAELLNKPIPGGQQRLAQMKAQMNALLSRPYDSLSPEEKQTLKQLMQEVAANVRCQNPGEEARLQQLLSKPYEQLTSQEKRELANLLNSFGAERERELEQMKVQLNSLMSKPFDSLTPEEKHVMFRLMREIGEYDPTRSAQDQAKLRELLSQPYENLSEEQKRILAELLTGSPEANIKRTHKMQAELDALLSKPFESLTQEDKAKLEQLLRILKPGPTVVRSDSMELKLAKLMARPYDSLTQEEKELLNHLKLLPHNPPKSGFRKFRTPSMEAELTALLARDYESLSPVERERLLTLLKETQPVPKGRQERTPSMEIRLAFLRAKPYETLTDEEKEQLNYLLSILQASSTGARLRTNSIQEQIQWLLSRPYESLSPDERQMLADLLINTQPAENLLATFQASGYVQRTKSMEMQLKQLQSIPYENLTQKEKDLLDYLSGLLPKTLERTPSLEQKFLSLSSQPLENLSPEDRKLLEQLKNLFCEHILSGRQNRTQSQEAKLAWLLAQPPHLLTEEQRREMHYLLTLDGPEDDIAYDPYGVSLVRTASMEETLNRLRAKPFDQLTPEEREQLIAISRLAPADTAEVPGQGWPWVLKVIPPHCSAANMRALRDLMNAASEHFNGYDYNCLTDNERYPPFIPYPSQALYFEDEIDPNGPQIHFWPWSMETYRDSRYVPADILGNADMNLTSEQPDPSNVVDSSTEEYKTSNTANTNCVQDTTQTIQFAPLQKSRSPEKKTLDGVLFDNVGANNNALDL